MFEVMPSPPDSPDLARAIRKAVHIRTKSSYM